MIQRCLASATKCFSFVVLGSVENQYLTGSASPFGHSINSHSSACGSDRQSSRCARRTRTAANREHSFCRVPCRQVMLAHEFAGSDSANSFTERADDLHPGE